MAILGGSCMLIKTYNLLDFSKKISAVLMAAFLIAGTVFISPVSNNGNTGGIFYFKSANAPIVKIIPANRQALKDSQNTKALVWISEKPNCFNNKFLFNTGLFIIGLIINICPASLKGVCSGSTYTKKLFHIRI